MFYYSQVGQYIGEICRYLLASKPQPYDRKHKLRTMVGNGLQPSIWVQFKEKFALPSIKELYAATEGNITLGKLLFFIFFSVWNMSF